MESELVLESFVPRDWCTFEVDAVSDDDYVELPDPLPSAPLVLGQLEDGSPESDLAHFAYLEESLHLSFSENPENFLCEPNIKLGCKLCDYLPHGLTAEELVAEVEDYLREALRYQSQAHENRSQASWDFAPIDPSNYKYEMSASKLSGLILECLSDQLYLDDHLAVLLDRRSKWMRRTHARNPARKSLQRK
jgi:hypothetical protein